MEEMQLSQLTEQLFQGFSLDGDKLTDAVLDGDFIIVVRMLWEATLDSIGKPFTYLWEYFIAFLLIGIGAATLKQLNHLYENTQIQKTSTWIVYLILIKQLMVLYYNGVEVASGCLGRLLEFGKVFVPTFSAALTLASGSLTGTGYIATLSLIIYVIEQILGLIVLPVIEAYMLLSILGSIWQKERVEHILNLLEKGVLLSFKVVFTFVTGISLLQSMILPFIDQTKVGAVKKVIGVIPGVGGISQTAMEMISGGAVLLKNGIGVIGILLLLVVCAAPLIKVGLICITLKVTAIVYGFLDEKNMTWCVDKLGIAQGFLLKVIGAGLILFVIWILLAVYTTNQRLWM